MAEGRSHHQPERGESSAAPVVVPVEQRTVALFEGDDVLAARGDTGDIYLPLRPICDSLGISYPTQITRIKKDEVLAEGLRQLRIMTAGGPQTMQCLELEAVPLWLAMIEPSRVREDLRDKLRVYKRWVRKRVWEAFALEMGLGRVTETTLAREAALDLPLEQIMDMGLAIANLARQQLAYEQDLADLRGHVEALDERVDRAAEVMREVIRAVRTLETRLAPGHTIGDEQAAEVKELVKAVAYALTQQQQGSATGTRTNAYQAIFGELYRRYGVTSYKLIRVDQYADVIDWLQHYRQAVSAGAEPRT